MANRTSKPKDMDEETNIQPEEVDEEDEVDVQLSEVERVFLMRQVVFAEGIDGQMSQLKMEYVRGSNYLNKI